MPAHNIQNVEHSHAHAFNLLGARHYIKKARCFFKAGKAWEEGTEVPFEADDTILLFHRLEAVFP